MIRNMILLTILTLLAQADTIKVASAAGYKKPVMALIKAFQQNGHHVEPLFGNMQQVMQQVKNGSIDIIIGDKTFLDKSELPLEDVQNIGYGKMVVAYAKHTSLSRAEDLKNESIRKIAMPQPKKAIYGTAGETFLKNTHLYDNVKNKLYIVATVPQVVAYLVAGEVDAGIINLTSALNNKDKIGGYILIDETTYSPIEIVVAKMTGCENDTCKEFMSFINSQTAQSIFRQNGL